MPASPRVDAKEEIVRSKTLLHSGVGVQMIQHEASTDVVVGSFSPGDDESSAAAAPEGQDAESGLVSSQWIPVWYLAAP